MIAERGTEARDAAPLQIGGGQGAKNWLASRKELARPRNAFAGGSIVALMVTTGRLRFRGGDYL
jgi:hypothetical protein